MLETSGSPGPAEAPSAHEIVARFSQIEVAAHPLFTGLRSRPLDLQAIWLLMNNLRAGISRDFVVWLASTIVRVEDRRIASLAAKQLNDELGNGDVSMIHSGLLDRFVDGLSPWALQGADERVLLAPGRRLSVEAGKLFRDPCEPYEAIGALMVGEIFAEKMDRCVGDEVRRQNGLSDEVLHWLVLHEALEVDHASDSSAIAALVPREGPALDATWRGAVAQWNVLWTFLDGVHQLSWSRATQGR